MNVPEHLGKALLREGGITTPRGVHVRKPDDAVAAARSIGGRVVLKAQIPTGKRGKGGGVTFAETPDEAHTKAATLLGSTINGHRVESLLVEQALSIERELYAAILNDGRSRAPLVLFSTEGGIDIEELNERAPDKIVRRTLDIRRGLDSSVAAEIVGGLAAVGEAASAPGLEAESAARANPTLVAVGARGPELADVLLRMYGRFIALDCELLEINPLAIESTTGKPVALDCKMTIDDSSRPRHPELFAKIEQAVGPTGTALERRARELGLYYIELDGDVGILANGAGLTMTTIDAVAQRGGKPANFLEIGGDAYSKATSALELVLANPRVKSVLVNFCGAFARTDVMAEGVIAAFESLRPRLPFFFSIHGTGEQRAIDLVRERLGIEPHDRMDDAVQAAVETTRCAAPAEAAPNAAASIAAAAHRSSSRKTER